MVCKRYWQEKKKKEGEKIILVMVVKEKVVVYIKSLLELHVLNIKVLRVLICLTIQAVSD